MDPIIAGLIKDACPYKKIRKFSVRPGIYAIFFTGSDFPLPDYSPQKNELVYIGKTLSSQESRDERTHFSTGKTGNSTLRRSLGALLKDKLSLIPVPRNDNDFDAGRNSFFKFDDPSEEKLTAWMKDNLGLSFYEDDSSSAVLDELETRLIEEVKPLLNIDSKNAANPYAKLIQEARKACAGQAKQTLLKKNVHHETDADRIITGPTDPLSTGRSVFTYEDIFKKALPQVEQAIDASVVRKLSIQLSQDDFKKAGKRQSYSFNLEFSDGIVANDIGGSAVARDLAKVLEQNAGILRKLKGKHMKFNMDKGFTLWVNNK